MVGEECKEDDNYCEIIEPIPKAIPSRDKRIETQSGDRSSFEIESSREKYH